LDEEPVPVHFDTLAAPPVPESEYLPSRDDQSWRELEALRIAAALNESIVEMPADEPADQEFDQQEDIPEPGATSRGQGGILFLMAAVAALVIVALAFPDIVTSGFWSAPRAALAANPASAPARAANIPAPPLQRLTPPADNPGLTTKPAANAMPLAAPDRRPAARMSGTMVISPDGAVKYENAGPPKRAPVRHAAGDRGAGGFYAKVPGPDGVLRYRYFPSAR
jgi:hypothetical protein